MRIESISLSFWTMSIVFHLTKTGAYYQRKRKLFFDISFIILFHYFLPFSANFWISFSHNFFTYIVFKFFIWRNLRQNWLKCPQWSEVTIKIKKDMNFKMDNQFLLVKSITDLWLQFKHSQFCCTVVYLTMAGLRVGANLIYNMLQ